MNKRRYVALTARGPNGLYYHFPDIPGFTVEAEKRTGIDAHVLELQQLQDHLDGLAAQGHPVPEPTPIRALMADPANHQPHRVFDLDELRAIKRTLAELVTARHVLDEQDMAETHRYIACYGEDDFLAGEVEFARHPGISRLQEIFGDQLDDLLLYACYPIGPKEAESLEPYIDTSLELDRYTYFLEACDQKDEAPTQES